jgi:hypothetical protein
MVPVRLYDTTGRLICQQSLLHDGNYEIPSNLVPGMYVMQGINGGETSSVKIFVK